MVNWRATCQTRHVLTFHARLGKERLNAVGHRVRRHAQPVALLIEVVDPDEQELLVDPLAALGVEDLFEEVLVLEQLEQGQTLGVPVRIKVTLLINHYNKNKLANYF